MSIYSGLDSPKSEAVRSGVSSELDNYLFPLEQPITATSRGFALWESILGVFVVWHPPNAFKSLGQDPATGWFYSAGLIAGWLAAGWGFMAWATSDERVYLIAAAIPLMVGAGLIIHISRISNRISSEGKAMLNKQPADLASLTPDERVLKAVLAYKIWDDGAQCAKILEGLDTDQLTDDRHVVFVKDFRRREAS